jgi:L-glyceraldehyde 3-phosphate reductase
MFDRWIENGLTDVLQAEGIGSIVFSPLAQGLLSNKYLQGIPDGSRASTAHGYLRPEHITDIKLEKVSRLNALAETRGQTLAQMALAWVLRLAQVNSALIGASKVSQIEDAAGALNNLGFSNAELEQIEIILKT